MAPFLVDLVFTPPDLVPFMDMYNLFIYDFMYLVAYILYCCDICAGG